jgi:hypothetical protein
MNITPPTEIEKEFTNKIRRQALLDANRELEYFIETTSQSQVKWWYEQAKKNNIDRMELYI